MRYYHYLSVAKVDMLFPQLSSQLRESMSAQLGIHLGVASASFKADAARYDTAVKQLAAVERHIVDSGSVGTIDHPAPWIRDEMNVRTLGFWTGGNAVFFVSDRCTPRVVLGGSSHHLLGSDPLKREGRPKSNLGPLMEAIESFVTDEGSFAPGTESVAPENGDWERLLFELGTTARGPTQRVHFLARVLAQGIGTACPVILASPLYVADGPLVAA